MRRVVLLRSQYAMIFALRSAHALVILLRGEELPAAPVKLEVV